MRAVVQNGRVIEEGFASEKKKKKIVGVETGYQWPDHSSSNSRLKSF